MDDPFSGLYSDPYAVQRVQRSVEVLNARAGDTVLDVGCYKQFSCRFLPEGVVYKGVDIDRFHPDTIVMNIDGGFDHEPVDRILCLETLEHLKWPRKTLASISRALKPSGIAVISLPNEATIFHRIRSFLGTPDAEAFSENGKHLHLPNKKQAIKFILREFKIMSIEPYISLSAESSRQATILRQLIQLLPESIWHFLADKFPSLFARGFIFVCQKNP